MGEDTDGMAHRVFTAEQLGRRRMVNLTIVTIVVCVGVLIAAVVVLGGALLEAGVLPQE